MASFLGILALVGGCLPAVPPPVAPAPFCREEGIREGAAMRRAIAWVVPTEDAATLDLWCSAVGSAVTQPLPERPSETAGIDSFPIVTWNTRVGAGDLHGLVTDLRAGRLTDGTPVRDFVLLLQEVHRSGGSVPVRVPAGGVPARVDGEPVSGPRVDVVEAGRSLGLSLLYVPSMRNGAAMADTPAEDRGNAILATFPLRNPTAIELPFEAQRRVAVAATLRGTTAAGAEWALLVSSVHFDTRSTGTRLLDSFGAGRLRQAEGLMDALALDIPTVVAGDLNTWSLPSLERSIPYLRTLFPQSPCPLGEPTFTTGWGLQRTLDHIFFRTPGTWAGELRRIDDRYGSDHYPLISWVHVGRPVPTATRGRHSEVRRCT